MHPSRNAGFLANVQLDTFLPRHVDKLLAKYDRSLMVVFLKSSHVTRNRNFVIFEKNERKRGAIAMWQVAHHTKACNNFNLGLVYPSESFICV